MKICSIKFKSLPIKFIDYPSHSVSSIVGIRRDLDHLIWWNIAVNVKYYIKEEFNENRK